MAGALTINQPITAKPVLLIEPDVAVNKTPSSALLAKANGSLSQLSSKASQTNRSAPLIQIARSFREPDRAGVLDQAERQTGAKLGLTKVSNVKLLNGNASIWVGNFKTVQGDINDGILTIPKALFAVPFNYGPNQQEAEVFLIAGDTCVSLGRFKNKDWQSQIGYFLEGSHAPNEHNLFRNPLVNKIAARADEASFALEQTYQSRQPQIDINLSAKSIVPGETQTILNTAMAAGIVPQSNGKSLLLPDNAFGGKAYAMVKFAAYQNGVQHGLQQDSRPIRQQVPGASQAFYRGVEEGYEKIRMDGLVGLISALWSLAPGAKGAQVRLQTSWYKSTGRPTQIVSKIPFAGPIDKLQNANTQRLINAEQRANISAKNRTLDNNARTPNPVVQATPSAPQRTNTRVNGRQDRTAGRAGSNAQWQNLPQTVGNGSSGGQNNQVTSSQLYTGDLKNTADGRQMAQAMAHAQSNSDTVGKLQKGESINFSDGGKVEHVGNGNVKFTLANGMHMTVAFDKSSGRLGLPDAAKNQIAQGNNQAAPNSVDAQRLQLIENTSQAFIGQRMTQADKQALAQANLSIKNNAPVIQDATGKTYRARDFLKTGGSWTITPNIVVVMIGKQYHILTPSGNPSKPWYGTVPNKRGNGMNLDGALTPSQSTTVKPSNPSPDTNQVAKPFTEKYASEIELAKAIQLAKPADESARLIADYLRGGLDPAGIKALAKSGIPTQIYDQNDPKKQSYAIAQVKDGVLRVQACSLDGAPLGRFVAIKVNPDGTYKLSNQLNEAINPAQKNQGVSNETDKVTPQVAQTDPNKQPFKDTQAGTDYLTSYLSEKLGDSKIGKHMSDLVVAHLSKQGVAQLAKTLSSPQAVDNYWGRLKTTPAGQDLFNQAVKRANTSGQSTASGQAELNAQANQARQALTTAIEANDPAKAQQAVNTLEQLEKQARLNKFNNLADSLKIIAAQSKRDLAAYNTRKGGTSVQGSANSDRNQASPAQLSSISATNPNSIEAKAKGWLDYLANTAANDPTFQKRLDDLRNGKADILSTDDMDLTWNKGTRTYDLVVYGNGQTFRYSVETRGKGIDWTVPLKTPIASKATPVVYPLSAQQQPGGAVVNQSTPTSKPAIIRIGDGIQVGLNLGAKSYNWMVTGVSANTTDILKKVEQHRLAQGIAYNPLVQTTLASTVMLSNSYHWLMRSAGDNPLVYEFRDKYQAIARQGRFFPALKEALNLKEKKEKDAETAVQFYGKSELAVGVELRKVVQLQQELIAQSARLRNANQSNNQTDIKDATKRIHIITEQMDQIQLELSIKYDPLYKALDKQIKEGEELLVKQANIAAVRQKELQAALAKSGGIDNATVLAAKQKLKNAQNPTTAHEDLQIKRTALDEATTQFGVNSSQASDARLAYEKTKTELAKYTLSGNSPLIDIHIDRDADLKTQVAELKLARNRLTFEMPTYIGDTSSAVNYGQSVVDMLAKVQADARSSTNTAQQKLNSYLGAEFRVQNDTRIDEVSVSARASKSSFATELAGIGFVRSKAKDLFDGKGKGRIDTLSNKKNIQGAQAKINEITTEISQLSNRLAELEGYITAGPAAGASVKVMTAMTAEQAKYKIQLGDAEKRLKGATNNLSLEQRASDPRQIELRLADIDSLVRRGATELTKAEKIYAQRQPELNREMASIQTQITAFDQMRERSGRPADSPVNKLDVDYAKLVKKYQSTFEVMQANDYAIDRARNIQAKTVDLRAEAAIELNEALANGGLTTGKVLRGGLRKVKAFAKASALVTLSQLAFGLVKPDTPNQMKTLLQQLNLPGGEAGLLSAEVIPNSGGAVLLGTVQGPLVAWRVRGAASDMIAVAQPLPQARGLLAAALFNGGKAGSLTPSIQQGSSGVYLTMDSQRIAMSSLLAVNVFHPPGSTAVNYVETTKVEFVAVGLTTRINTGSTNPRTGAQQIMGELVQSNTIKFPGVLPLLGRSIKLAPGMGVAVTVKSSFGLGQLSLVYDPIHGAGQRSDRTSSWAGKFNGKDVMNEWNPGTQPYGFFGTAVRLEKNYYAKADSANDGNWIMNATAPLETVFDGLTGKPITSQLTPAIQDQIRQIKLKNLDNWLLQKTLLRNVPPDPSNANPPAK